MKQVYILLLIFLILPVKNILAQKTQKKVNLYGYVFEKSGYPIPDAMILVDEVRQSKNTNSKGFFKIKIPAATEKISIVSLSHGSMELPYNGADTLIFEFENRSGQLIPKKSEIGEVVDVGYGTSKTRDLSVDVDQIVIGKQESIKYSNIYDMIKGEVGGVIVSGRSIRIQGTGSIMGSNQPIFIVNGMEIASIDHLLPSDVNSISVLKGAAATIYGSRGSNGVILIKLK